MRNLKFINYLFIVFLCAIASHSFAKSTDFEKSFNDASKLRLIYSVDDNASNKLLLGLDFKIKKGWKIYGPDSEGIGIAPTIQFENLGSIHRFIWPSYNVHEENFAGEKVKYTTYEDNVVIPLEVNLNKDENYLGKVVKVEVNYALCKDICVPVNSKFDLEFEVAPNKEDLAFIRSAYEDKNLEMSGQGKKDATLTLAITFAVIGGLILNIMPCVLPIISLKLISIINHSNSSIRTIRIAFISTFFGIIFSFAVFALLASTFKLAGNHFGWGLQFQNTYYLIFLIVITTVFITNLLGVFDFSANSLANWVNKRIDKKEGKKRVVITKNFLSGILAVLLATPCSAPFLGYAISYGLTKDISTIYAIFIAIGVGFGTPYLLLFIFPRSIYFIPKPGKWMLLVEKILLVFLILTLIWLLLVLSKNTDLKFTFFVTCCAILFIILSLLISWFIDGYKGIKRSRKKIILMSILSIIAAASLFVFYDRTNIEKYRKNMQQDNMVLEWEKFDEEKLNQYVKDGRIVVLDFTANWCITCQYNKVRIFNNSEIIKFFKKNNVITMRADLTKSNDKAIIFMARYNRFAIPFNVIFGPKHKSGVVTKVVPEGKDFINIINEVKDE